MVESCIAGNQVLLDDGSIGPAQVRLRNGQISGLSSPDGTAAFSYDGPDQFILPGIVDLHGDAFERQIMPRPGVMLPVTTAMMDTDSQLVANGIQIFPGSVPIYRGTQLVGGIGVSGDGIDQDDMISFLGLHLAGEKLGTVNNAPPEMRADLLSPQGVRLRYINCPQSPFLDSDEQNVCSGK